MAFSRTDKKEEALALGATEFFATKGLENFSLKEKLDHLFITMSRHLKWGPYFAAKHGIKPILEEFPMSIEGASATLKKFKEGQVRYRAVLKV